MEHKKLLREGNFFYMLAFILTGVLFTLSSQLCKVVAVGETQTALLTTMSAQLAPGLAALIARRRFGSLPEHKGVSRLQHVLLLCLLVPLVSIGAQYLLLAATGQGAQPSAFFATSQLAVLSIVTALIGSVGEEVGWRGYLYKRLKSDLKPWCSAALSSVMWGLWHVTKVFQLGLGHYLLFALSMVPLGMLMCYAVDRAGGSIMPAIVMHLLQNLGFMYLLYGRESIGGYFISTLAVCLVLLVIRRLDPLYFQSTTRSPAVERV